MLHCESRPRLLTINDDENHNQIKLMLSPCAHRVSIQVNGQYLGNIGTYKLKSFVDTKGLQSYSIFWFLENQKPFVIDGCPTEYRFTDCQELMHRVNPNSDWEFANDVRWNDICGKLLYLSDHP